MDNDTNRTVKSNSLPVPDNANTQTENEVSIDPEKSPIPGEALYTVSETEVYSTTAEVYEDQYEYHDLPKKRATHEQDDKKTEKKFKKTKVKMKLRVGSEVEVYSNTLGKWVDGKIVEIKGKLGLVCIAYGTGKGSQKWLEATSKSFRPKLKKHVQNDLKTPQAPKKRKQSVALQQKKPVKVKLRVGSPVEVFSVSQNRWIDGKLSKIKKDLIRIAYGENFNTEKWLKGNSKQFRPKLDMVDEAFLRKNKLNKDDEKYDYSIDNQEKKSATHKRGKSALGSFLTDMMKGSYITHSLRREQYQEDSVQSVRGIQNKRGDLKVKIHGALQLRHTCNFAQITLLNYTLKTKKVATDENPVWKEILRFSNFRPQIGKTAVVAVGNKNILQEKIVGKAEFELPIVFNRKEKMTVDIMDNKKKLCGIIELEQCVVDHGK